MPLSLGDASTERPHVITFDPASPAESKEAKDTMDRLVERGFKINKESYGEVTLIPPPRNPNEGVFRVLSENGDDRIVWDRTKPSQVREAFDKFKDFLKRGYTAYASLISGKKGHKLDDFDPGLEEVILVPSTMPG